ncbi:hypothetical protein MKX03_035531 [Papaver bracteatum]|nr:hypothetical protein MKX03_035531 [Papaver bracteatum]
MVKASFFILPLRSTLLGFSETKHDDYKTNKNLMLELDFEPFFVFFHLTFQIYL